MPELRKPHDPMRDRYLSGCAAFDRLEMIGCAPRRIVPTDVGATFAELLETGAPHGPAYVGWVIDNDHLADPGEPTRVGYGQTAEQVGGFHSVSVTCDLSRTQVPDPVRFRTLDEDGEVYYSGVMSRAWLDGDEERAFGPLAFAQADAGATDLQYWTVGRGWTAL